MHVKFCVWWSFAISISIYSFLSLFCSVGFLSRKQWWASFFPLIFFLASTSSSSSSSSLLFLTPHDYTAVGDQHSVWFHFFALGQRRSDDAVFWSTSRRAQQELAAFNLSECPKSTSPSSSFALTFLTIFRLILWLGFVSLLMPLVSCTFLFLFLLPFSVRWDDDNQHTTAFWSAQVMEETPSPPWVQN